MERVVVLVRVEVVVVVVVEFVGVAVVLTGLDAVRIFDSYVSIYSFINSMTFTSGCESSRW